MEVPILYPVRASNTLKLLFHTLERPSYKMEVPFHKNGGAILYPGSTILYPGGPYLEVCIVYTGGANIYTRITIPHLGGILCMSGDPVYVYISGEAIS